jgi:Cdc6-like AAA superfamily ATPase
MEAFTASMCAENLSDEDIERLRVDRLDEIRLSTIALGRGFQNVLLYGYRGVGKTFLVRLIVSELQKAFPEVLPVYVTTAGLKLYNPVDEVAAFSRAVLLEICVELWKHVLGKSYLDLREYVSASDANLNFGNIEEKTIQRIYSLLMGSQRRTVTQIHNRIGFSAGIQGEKSDDLSVEKQSSEVLPFEFGEFIDELLTHVVHKKGKGRIVVLCDDANRMPMFRQEDILTRYFDLFRLKKVQFLFVAAWQDWEHDVHVPLCFEQVMQINGFADISVFREFIVKSSDRRATFDDDALTYLHESCKGHPTKALDILVRAWNVAERQNSKTLKLSFVKEASDQFWLGWKDRQKFIVKTS